MMSASAQLDKLKTTVTHTPQTISMSNIGNSIVANCFTFEHESEFETIITNNGMDKCYKIKCGHDNKHKIVDEMEQDYQIRLHNLLQIQAQHESFDVSKISEYEPMAKQNIIKQEVLCFIPEYRFDETKKKTMHMYHNCYNIRKYKTEADGQFGEETWEKGDEISFCEMFCLKLFIDHNILQQKCHQLCHFSHKILMIISKFGTNKCGMKLYVFINSNMILNPGNISFYLPLSTT
eukprot:100867_1